MSRPPSFLEWDAKAVHVTNNPAANRMLSDEYREPDSRDSMDSGDTLFDPRVGMPELLAAWPNLTKRVIPI